MNPNIKIKEMSASRSAVLPTGYYENIRPTYTITFELQNGEDPEKAMNSINEYLCQLIDEDDKKARAELIQKRYKNFRFYYRNGKKYVSVTTVLGYGDRYTKFKKFTDDELSQYAAQGNIIEALVNQYLKSGKWIDPEKHSELQKDVVLLKVGSLKFHWNQCSYRQFMEKYRNRIGKIEGYQIEVYNDDEQYAGRLDILGEFDGKKSVIDIKRNYFDIRQLAAYAACLDDIEQLVIFKVGPCDNKCGYYQPIIETDIQKRYDEFLSARMEFKEKFGV